MEEEGKAVVEGKESEARGLHAPQCAGGKEAACDESGVQVCSGKGQAGGEAAAFARRLVAAAGFARRLTVSVGLFLRGLALLLIPVPRCRRLVVGLARVEAPLDHGRALQ